MVIPEVKGSMSYREGTNDDDILSKVTKSNLDSIMKVKDKKGRKPLPKIDDIIKKSIEQDGADQPAAPPRDICSPPFLHRDLWEHPSSPSMRPPAAAEYSYS